MKQCPNSSVVRVVAIQFKLQLSNGDKAILRTGFVDVKIQAIHAPYRMSAGVNAHVFCLSHNYSTITDSTTFWTFSNS